MQKKPDLCAICGSPYEVNHSYNRFGEDIYPLVGVCEKCLGTLDPILLEYIQCLEARIAAMMARIEDNSDSISDLWDR